MSCALMARKPSQKTALLTAYLTFPAAYPRRLPERDERTAMYSERLSRRVKSFEAGQKDASGTPRGAEATFRMDLRPDFPWPQVEVAGKERDERQRSIGVERGENRILGGSDPTLSGLSAAQRLRRRGSLPPSVSTRISRSVAGREPGKQLNRFES